MSAPSIACPRCGTHLPPGASECTRCEAADATHNDPLAGAVSEASTFSGPGGAAAPAADPVTLGPYRVLGKLGAGGMGAVYRAEDPQLRRPVAVKVMLPRFAAQPTAKERFLREARAAAAVEHDHIIPIWYIGEQDGAPFVAMPLLKGESLADRLHRDHTLPVAEALRVAREIALGLAAAHAQGLIHRDIKPANVWLEGEARRVKILDFGLARSVAADDGTEYLTDENTIVGTPAYMSPEQSRNLDLDGRSDLYSLGVVLFQMLTGRLPFTARGSVALLTALAVDPPPAPRSLNPNVPPGVNDLVLRLLAKAPGDRPAPASEVARLLADQLVAVTVVPVAGPPVEVPAAGPDPWTELDIGPPPSATEVEAPAPRPPAIRRARPRWPAVAAVAGIGLVAAGGVVALFLTVFAPKGTLVIDTADPDAEVVVKRDGAVVRDRTRDREIPLKPGDYTVELAGAREGMKLSAERVTIVKNGKETVRIRVDRPVAETPKTPPKPPAPEAADRKAAEALHPHAEVILRLPDGQWVDVKPADPLPAKPFVVTGVRFVRPEPRPPDFVPAVLLPALAGLKQLTAVEDYGREVRWSEPDFARLAETPCRDTLTEFTTGVELTPSTADLLGRFPRLDKVRLFAEAADDAALARLPPDRLAGLLVHDLGRSGRVTAAGWGAVVGASREALTLDGPTGVDAAVGRLLAGRPALHHLSLYRAALDADTLREIGRCPKLRTLDLTHSTVPDAGLVHLANLKTLDTLSLTDTGVSDAGVKPLAALAANLRVLHVGQNRVTGAGRQWLAANLPRCRVVSDGFELGPTDRDWVAADHFLTNPGWYRIAVELPDGKAAVVEKRADLPTGPFTLVQIVQERAPRPLEDADLNRLAGLTQLRVLAAPGNAVSDAGVKDLLSLKGSLEAVDLPAVTDAGMPTVGQFTRLKSLTLGPKVTDAGVGPLANLGRLEGLHLTGPGVTDAGLKHLAGLKLTSLNLDATGVSDAGIESLVGKRDLGTLNVVETRVTEAGFKRLQAALPKCTIHWLPDRVKR